jgi:hypothetical protein
VLIDKVVLYLSQDLNQHIQEYIVSARMRAEKKNIAHRAGSFSSTAVLSDFVFIPGGDKRHDKQNAGNQEKNTTNDGQGIPVFQSGGDKKEGADDEEQPSGQVQSSLLPVLRFIKFLHAVFTCFFDTASPLYRRVSHTNTGYRF